MEIPEIKSHLSILTVVHHYGCKSTRNNLLRCPFHDDKTASLQVYPETNTWHCFGCGKGRDGIDFIQFKEQCTQHEAFLKAEQFISHLITKSMKSQTSSNGKDQQVLQPLSQQQRTETLTAAFTCFVHSMPDKNAAQAHLQKRAIDWKKITVGYDNNTFHKEKSVSKTQKERYLQAGLLYPDKLGKANNFQSRFDGCVVFPVLDEQGNIVWLYGRHTEKDAHYKLPGAHQGLYPKYPNPDTEKIIITECIIDCATLLQHDFITKEYSLLSLYGAEIWTAEHSKAIQQLEQLKEVIFALDGDKAGREATQKHAQLIRQIHPKIIISDIAIPDNEDINSLAQGHSQEIFTELLDNRKPISNTPFFLSPEINGLGTPVNMGNGNELKIISGERKNGQPANDPMTNDQMTNNQSTGKLDTTNPHRIIYRTPTATYYIKGGLRNDLDSMKVSIDIENNQTGLKKRERMDLYMDKLTEKLSREAAEKLMLRADLIESDLSKLTDLLDEYRTQTMLEEDTGEKPRDKTRAVAHNTTAACIDFLEKPELMKRFFEMTTLAGLVGEEKSRMLVFCIASSFKMQNTLHGIIQGTSGEGKTYLMTTICEMMPEEYHKPLTTMTDKSLFNMKKYQIHRHLITIEDRVGMSEEVRMYFRELISKGMLIRDATVSDKEGNYSTKTQVIMGPMASITCTTEAEIHQDDANRCFLISIDESHEQRRRIIEHRNKSAAGLIDKQKEEGAKIFMQNCIRLIKSYQVINPYATKISLPEDAKDLIRLHNLFIGLIEQITLLHQYQRKKDRQGRLITEIEDVETAVDVMFDAIVLKVDDLNEKLRKFFERLKHYVKNKGGEKFESYNFKLREIRMELDMCKTTVHENIQELLEMEYLQKVSGNDYQGYIYKIAYWDDITILRTRIKRNLQEQIDKIQAPARV